MSEFKTPKINSSYICIASKNASLLAGLVSSYFNSDNEYFAIFLFPEVSHPFKDNNNFESDGFVSRMIGDEAAVLINNAIVKIRPSKIILAGLSEMQKTFLFKYIPEEITIDINSEEDVGKNLQFLNAKFQGDLFCKSEEISQGLIIAKYNKLKIVLNKDSRTLPKKYVNKGQGIVVIELNDDAGDVLAINYAFSIKADIKLIQPVKKSEVHSLQELVYNWKRQNSQSDYKDIKNKVTKRLKGIDFKIYEFGTFFTHGLPYGLILDNIIPFSHVLDVRSDFFIFDNIIYEQIEPIGSGIVFSPKVFEYEETETVIKQLESNNFIVKQLVEKNATVNNLDNFGAHYPYDLLHICSHGGETPGYYVIQKFIDRKNKEHTIEYDEVVGFSPDDVEDQVRVFTKAIFRKFDGYKWMSDELRSQKIPGYVYEDMRKALKQDSPSKNLLRVKGGYAIYSSCHITCYDSIHQGQFRQLANYRSPLIFNNTCSSWYEIAVLFIAYGARSYIGTIWEIGNTVAIKSAELFYNSISRDPSIIQAVYEVNQSIEIDKYKNIYFFWGLHFSTLKKPNQKDEQKIFNELVDSYMRWGRKYQETKTLEVKNNTISILKFLYKLIHSDFTIEHAKKFKEEVDATIEKYIKALPEERDSVDLSERSIINLN